ncbi:FAD-binding oxidoreductase [Nannocystis sp. ILAH1]|uniref:FAD-binding oxidoreductase n=1 Tax=Nannocystis sp. ILAH1 TaxID=2996789 RepID=UPI00227064CB|nr:FAD-binding oxidoreductase [Nannocystis sp. ILAH1]MCY0989542.1 FAD-binding oxidoreductase [Nannocystis sp. ILAH1]
MFTHRNLTGRVVYPGDPDYAAARRDYNLRIDVRPSAIVFAQQPLDVQSAVAWARANGVPPAMRSGRHSYEGFSLVENGIVIDVSSLDSVEYDDATGLAKIGAGAQLLPIYEALAHRNVTIPGGSCPTVGIAGLTLGGGFGLLGRSRGLTCDSLVEVEMVDAKGGIVLASETRNSELFWALRGGGGGNFGVVTSFTFRAAPIGPVAIYRIQWPWEQIQAVTAAWQAWAPGTDRRLVSILQN